MSASIPFSNDHDLAVAALRSLTSERVAEALLSVIDAIGRNDEDDLEDTNGSRQAAPHNHRPTAGGSDPQQGTAADGATAGHTTGADARAGQDGLTGIPDQITAIVGWRAWKIDPWRPATREPALVSLHFDEPWRPRKPLVARCDEPKRRHAPPSCACPLEAAPATNCRCGIYAARELEHIAKYVNGAPELHASEILVLGRVALWGRVVEYEDGWRAEYGYPQSFFVPPDLRDNLGAMHHLLSFGIPVLDDTELVEAFGWDRAAVDGGTTLADPPPIPDAPGLAADVAAISVDGLDLPPMFIRAAHREGAHRLGQLLALSRDELGRCRGLGAVMLDKFSTWRLANGYGDYPIELIEGQISALKTVEITCRACGSTALAFTRGKKFCDPCSAINRQISPVRAAAKNAAAAGMRTTLFDELIAELEAQRPTVRAALELLEGGER